MKKFLFSFLCFASSAFSFQLPYVTLHSCDPTESYFISWDLGPPSGQEPDEFIGCFKDVLFFDQSYFYQFRKKLCQSYPHNCSLSIYIGSMNDPKYTQHLIARAFIDASTMMLTSVEQSQDYQNFKVLANHCKNMIDVVAPGTTPEEDKC